MSYVDGFVLLVPTKKLKEYAKLAKKEHGALEYYETTGDDMKTKMGIPFPKLAGAKKTDTVVFSWIVYKSKAHRNAVNKKVMSDKRLMEDMDMDNMPFDCNRMSYGGFKTLVKA
ncbi:MAG: uncharacterized protein K0R10_2710 [Alphaproteobacteria bacterium]|nr:uncharacterized protein [Alphaproteobacteria bacterium]